MNNFDFIIIGAGCSGLSLLYEMNKSNILKNKTCAVFDKRKQFSKDKIWSYWNVFEHSFSDCLLDQWDKVIVKGNEEIILDCKDFAYQSVDSEKFYNKILKNINDNKNIKLFLDHSVDEIREENDQIIIKSKNELFKANLVFDSSLKINNSKDSKIYQHFYGCEVNFKENINLSKYPTLMDFNCDQGNWTHFFYTLPLSDKKIFIEKPFGGYTNTKLNNILESNAIHIGYVLRFNPCIQWVKTHINPQDIKSIHGQYLSNTIEKKPKGWRNGSFSGVLNEMGSHVIDLILYILEDDNMDVLFSKKESIVSDVDDIVEAKLKTSNDISISMYFNWVKKDVRKPVFGLEIEMKDGHKYYIDQQQVNKYNSNGDFIEKVAVTDLVKAVPFYLRGVDFTDQMSDLLANQKIIASANNALGVNILMEKILNHENNTGR